MIEHSEVSELFNLGTGHARSFHDLAVATFHAMGLEPKIRYIEMPEALRPKYQYYTQASMNKLYNTGGGIEPLTSLENGIKDYVCNYLAKKYKIY